MRAPNHRRILTLIAQRMIDKLSWNAPRCVLPINLDIAQYFVEFYYMLKNDQKRLRQEAGREPTFWQLAISLLYLVWKVGLGGLKLNTAEHTCRLPAFQMENCLRTPKPFGVEPFAL